MRRKPPAPIWLTLLFLGLPCIAHAYVDPGTGSLIFQMIIAGLVGASFAVRLFWRNIRLFFGRIFTQGSGRDEPSK